MRWRGSKTMGAEEEEEEDMAREVCKEWRERVRREGKGGWRRERVMLSLRAAVRVVGVSAAAGGALGLCGINEGTGRQRRRIEPATVGAVMAS